MVAKVEHHQGELFPRVGFLVTTGERPAYLIRLADDGPGIPNIDAILEGRNSASNDLVESLQGGAAGDEFVEVNEQA